MSIPRLSILTRIPLCPHKSEKKILGMFYYAIVKNLILINQPDSPFFFARYVNWINNTRFAFLEPAQEKKVGKLMKTIFYIERETQYVCSHQLEFVIWERVDRNLASVFNIPFMRIWSSSDKHSSIRNLKEKTSITTAKNPCPLFP